MSGEQRNRPLVKNQIANAGDTSLIPGPRRSHAPWSSEALEPQLSLCSRAPRAATTTVPMPRVPALQQEKPLQQEACESQLEGSLLTATGEKLTKQQRPSRVKKINK